MSQRPEVRACADVLERLEAYVDGELGEAEAATVEAHLDGCAACTAEYRLASTVRRELRAFPELDAPPAVLESLLKEAERARRPLPFRVPVPAPRRAWASLAAAVFATAVLGASLWWGALRQAPGVAPAVPPEGGQRTATVDPEAADPEAVARATAEARYALAYLTRVHRRAGLKLRDDLFVDRVARPSVESLARSLSPRRSSSAADTDRSGLTGRDRS